MKLTIEIRKLTVSEYQTLRQTTGWDMLDDKVVKMALENDLFSLIVVDGNTPIGMGRVIGDGGIYFYIQDIIVHPKYQKAGIGKLIMQHIETFLKESAPHNAFIGLMAAAGVQEFYHSFGYKVRPENGPGMFKRMSK